jgi:hypothetical protein
MKYSPYLYISQSKTNHMKLELVKEYSKTGEVSYYVNEDGNYIRGTASQELTEALDQFYRIKKNYTEARVEVLMVEEV